MTTRVEIVDQTCLKMSAKKSKYAHHQCVVAADTVRLLANETGSKGTLLLVIRTPPVLSLVLMMVVSLPSRPGSLPTTLIQGLWFSPKP